MIRSGRIRVTPWVIGFALLFGRMPTAARAQENAWPAVNPADLSRTEGEIEPGAQAEILQKMVRIDHRTSTTAVWSYRSSFIRVKVYTRAGVEEFESIELPSSDDVKIEAVQARVVHPDLTIVDVAADAIFDREVAKKGRRTASVKVVVVPALQPGDIVDYRWREVDSMSDGIFEILPFYAEHPIRDLRYEVKGVAFQGAPPLWWEAVNMESPPREVITGGVTVFRGSRLAAVLDEPAHASGDFHRSVAVCLLCKAAGSGNGEAMG